MEIKQCPIHGCTSPTKGSRVDVMTWRMTRSLDVLQHPEMTKTSRIWMNWCTVIVEWQWRCWLRNWDWGESQCRQSCVNQIALRWSEGLTCPGMSCSIWTQSSWTMLSLESSSMTLRQSGRASNGRWQGLPDQRRPVCQSPRSQWCSLPSLITNNWLHTHSCQKDKLWTNTSTKKCSATWLHGSDTWGVTHRRTRGGSCTMTVLPHTVPSASDSFWSKDRSQSWNIPILARFSTVPLLVIP